jgi:hypothetical protein
MLSFNPRIAAVAGFLALGLTAVLVVLVAQLRRVRLALLVLLCASTALEWSRLYRFEARLPDHAGGASVGVYLKVTRETLKRLTHLLSPFSENASLSVPGTRISAQCGFVQSVTHFQDTNR